MTKDEAISKLETWGSMHPSSRQDRAEKAIAFVRLFTGALPDSTTNRPGDPLCMLWWGGHYILYIELEFTAASIFYYYDLKIERNVLESRRGRVDFDGETIPPIITKIFEMDKDIRAG